MRTFIEKTLNRDFLEIYLSEEDLENLPISGACSKYYYPDKVNPKKKRLLDILIMYEKNVRFTPTEEWEKNEDEFGKFF